MKRHVLAIANHKGGTGKSTVTVNLSAALAERGRRVLVIDLDAQGTATAWLRGSPGPGLELVFRDGADLAPMVGPSSVQGVELVSAAPDLREQGLPLTAFVNLRRALRRLDGPWAYVLVDTPRGARGGGGSFRGTVPCAGQSIAPRGAGRPRALGAEPRCIERACEMLLAPIGRE